MKDKPILARGDYAGLKAAARNLVLHNGGAVDATALTRYADHAPISRQIGSDMDWFMPIDVVADLERAGGDPFVTRKLAELAGCLLIPLPRADAGGGGLTLGAGRSAEAFGRMLAGYGEGFRDGTIGQADAVRLLAGIRDVMVTLAAFAETVKHEAGREFSGQPPDQVRGFGQGSGGSR